MSTHQTSFKNTLLMQSSLIMARRNFGADLNLATTEAQKPVPPTSKDIVALPLSSDDESVKSSCCFCFSKKRTKRSSKAGKKTRSTSSLRKLSRSFRKKEENDEKKSKLPGENNWQQRLESPRESKDLRASNNNPRKIGLNESSESMFSQNQEMVLQDFTHSDFLEEGEGKTQMANSESVEEKDTIQACSQSIGSTGMSDQTRPGSVDAKEDSLSNDRARDCGSTQHIIIPQSCTSSQFAETYDSHNMRPNVDGGANSNQEKEYVDQELTIKLSSSISSSNAKRKGMFSPRPRECMQRIKSAKLRSSSLRNVHLDDKPSLLYMENDVRKRRIAAARFEKELKEKRYQSISGTSIASSRPKAQDPGEWLFGSSDKSSEDENRDATLHEHSVTSPSPKGSKVDSGAWLFGNEDEDDDMKGTNQNCDQFGNNPTGLLIDNDNNELISIEKYDENISSDVSMVEASICNLRTVCSTNATTHIETKESLIIPGSSFGTHNTKSNLSLDRNSPQPLSRSSDSPKPNVKIRRLTSITSDVFDCEDRFEAEDKNTDSEEDIQERSTKETTNRRNKKKHHKRKQHDSNEEDDSDLESDLKERDMDNQHEVKQTNTSPERRYASASHNDMVETIDDAQINESRLTHESANDLPEDSQENAAPSESPVVSKVIGKSLNEGTEDLSRDLSNVKEKDIYTEQTEELYPQFNLRPTGEADKSVEAAKISAKESITEKMHADNSNHLKDQKNCSKQLEYEIMKMNLQCNLDAKELEMDVIGCDDHGESHSDTCLSLSLNAEGGRQIYPEEDCNREVTSEERCRKETDLNDEETSKVETVTDVDNMEKDKNASDLADEFDQEDHGNDRSTRDKKEAVADDETDAEKDTLKPSDDQKSSESKSEIDTPTPGLKKLIDDEFERYPPSDEDDTESLYDLAARAPRSHLRDVMFDLLGMAKANTRQVESALRQWCSISLGPIPHIEGERLSRAINLFSRSSQDETELHLEDFQKQAMQAFNLQDELEDLREKQKEMEVFVGEGNPPPELAATMPSVDVLRYNRMVVKTRQKPKFQGDAWRQFLDENNMKKERFIDFKDIFKE